MAKNYMADVAKILGVELGEEFKISCVNGTYKFTTDGLEFKVREEWIVASFMSDLLTGKHKIIKLPWQPKNGDRYYFPGDGFTITSHSIWCGLTLEYALKEAGMIFRTAEECEAALPALREKYLGCDKNG